MPNLKNAKKALRQSKTRQLRNKTVNNNIKKLLKDSRKSVDAKSEKAGDLIQQAIKAIDKAVQKGVLKQNTGNRRKSRLMKKFNAVFQKTNSTD